MRFQYTSAPTLHGEASEKRPYLSCKVSGPKSSVAVLMLVDSGADESMLPLSLLRALGVQFSGETCDIGTWAREFEVGLVGSVGIQFGGGAFTLQSRMIGHDAIQVPVLGHRDFINRYIVKFDGGRKLFYVEEPRSIQLVQ